MIIQATSKQTKISFDRGLGSVLLKAYSFFYADNLHHTESSCRGQNWLKGLINVYT